VTLKDRCIKFLSNTTDEVRLQGRNLWTVDDLVDFVRSEIGRAADEALEGSEPLVLYFVDDKDRREFVDAVVEANPGFISRRWP
jgi:hypothetical protein